MIICPDCAHNLAPTSNCQQCGWQFELVEGFACYLSSTNKSDTSFNNYLENYDAISTDDLSNSIQNPEYLRIQNTKLYSYLGELGGFHVCEVGIGQGTLFDKIITSQPASVTAIDISTPYLHKIRERLSPTMQTALVVANAENIPFRAHFDVLVAADIIEHVFNVGNFLLSVNRAVKMGGKFVVKTPYQENINAYSHYRGCKYKFVHLRNFNRKLLTLLLEDAGFKIIKVHYDGYLAGENYRRSYVNKLWPMKIFFEKILLKCFTSEVAIAKINNFLGRLLMKPYEITVVCQKVRDTLQ